MSKPTDSFTQELLLAQTDEQFEYAAVDSTAREEYRELGMGEVGPPILALAALALGVREVVRRK